MSTACSTSATAASPILTVRLQERDNRYSVDLA
jgi:hypothetical protein